MYTLYYLNKNYQLGTIKVSTLEEPVRIPEDLVFCNLRKGINFIKEPHKCIYFTDIERLIMNSEFTDTRLLKESDFRKQNTYLTPLCPIDIPVGVFFMEESTSFSQGEHFVHLEIASDVGNTNIEVFSSNTINLDDFETQGILSYELREGEYHIYMMNIPNDSKRVFFKNNDTVMISRVFDVPEDLLPI